MEGCELYHFDKMNSEPLYEFQEQLLGQREIMIWY